MSTSPLNVTLLGFMQLSILRRSADSFKTSTMQMFVEC